MSREELEGAFAEYGATARRDVVAAFRAIPEAERLALAARIKAVGDEAKQYGITLRMFSD